MKLKSWLFLGKKSLRLLANLAPLETKKLNSQWLEGSASSSPTKQCQTFAWVAPQEQTEPGHVCYPGIQSSLGPRFCLSIPVTLTHNNIFFCSKCLKWVEIPTVVWSGIFQHGIEGVYWYGVCAMETREGATAAGFGLVTWVKHRGWALDSLPKGRERHLHVSRMTGGLRYMGMIRGQRPGCEAGSPSSWFFWFSCCKARQSHMPAL